MRKRWVRWPLVILLSIVTASPAWAGYVRGYIRRDGTYVQPYYRSEPDGNPYNNYSFPGNYNPYTGRIATGNPETYLNRYYQRQSDGGDGFFLQDNNVLAQPGLDDDQENHEDHEDQEDSGD